MTDPAPGTFVPFRLEIQVSPHLVGSKVAYQIGEGPILVSPAMFDLIKHATPEELETLLKTICVKKLPDFRLSPYQYIPLTTFPL